MIPAFHRRLLRMGGDRGDRLVRFYLFPVWSHLLHSGMPPFLSVWFAEAILRKLPPLVRTSVKSQSQPSPRFFYDYLFCFLCVVGASLALAKFP